MLNNHDVPAWSGGRHDARPAWYQHRGSSSDAKGRWYGDLLRARRRSGAESVLAELRRSPTSSRRSSPALTIMSTTVVVASNGRRGQGEIRRHLARDADIVVRFQVGTTRPYARRRDERTVLHLIRPAC